ncbi:MAG: hypothetical protein R3C59_27925 [Planctomycetaceae bacterium]
METTWWSTETLSTVRAEGRLLARRYRVEPDFAISEILGELAESENAPSQMLESTPRALRRAGDRSLKREERHSARRRTLDEQKSVEVAIRRAGPATLPGHSMLLAEVRQIARAECRDKFEDTLLDVLLGEHSLYQTKIEFITASDLSPGHAYRRIREFKSRLRDALCAWGDLIA